MSKKKDRKQHTASARSEAANTQRSYYRSIARGINMSVWMDKFASYILMDILMAAAACSMFILRYIVPLQIGSDPEDVRLLGHGVSELALEILWESGAVSKIPLGDWIVLVLPVILCVIGVQFISLVASLFRTGRYRRQLRPLETVTRRAQALSQVPLDMSHFENLEQALRSASPGDGSVHIETGDRELEGIENALNALLLRMQESYRQQTRFVSDASHELRTPIAVIQGYADLLARWGKDDPAVLEEGITSIQNESQHMKELVEQLLFLARGDSGRNTLHIESLDLNEVMREVYEESALIDTDHIYHLAQKPGARIAADRAMIKQSIRIFLQNAAKYSPAGSDIYLSVILDGSIAGYRVQDEGQGMSQEDLGHIFERFYRSDKARNSKSGGSGLGLSIAKWIVDAHGGAIDVVSSPGLGSRFTVTFPVK